MLSSRTRFDMRPNALATALAVARAEGRRLFDLTESNPTHAGLACPDDLLLPLAADEARRYDPSPFGLASAREAAAGDLARRGFPVPPERVFLSASTSEAYAFLFKLLADPGDEILVPHPGYPLFDFLATLESVRVQSYPLAYDDGWHVDFDALVSAVRPTTRAVIVVNPNNPTGVFLKRTELARLVALCADHELALVSDEVFADYSFREDSERAASVAVDGPALAFALSGLSKSCGLPQLKLAWTAVCGPEALRSQALARLELIADTYLSVGTPVQVALPRLLARRAELQQPIAARVRGNLDRLRQRVAGTPASLLPPEGGWYAVLRVPATLGEEERVLRLLVEHDVLVHPGYFFDIPEEAFLVLSLLTPPAEFLEGVERLIAEISSE